jgi:ribonucleotide monophosphatase NagD (HAD superfamily)
MQPWSRPLGTPRPNRGDLNFCERAGSVRHRPVSPARWQNIEAAPAGYRPCPLVVKLLWRLFAGKQVGGARPSKPPRRAFNFDHCKNGFHQPERTHIHIHIHRYLVGVSEMILFKTRFFWHNLHVTRRLHRAAGLRVSARQLHHRIDMSALRVRALAVHPLCTMFVLAYAILPGIADVLARRKYDAVVLDQFGVLHDGKRAYPFAIDCVRELHRRHVPCVVASNSSRLREDCLEQLESLGFRREWFAGAVTSGQLTQDALLELRQALRNRQREEPPATRVFHTNWTDRGRATLPSRKPDNLTYDYKPVGMRVEDAELVVTHGTEGVTQEDGQTVAPLPYATLVSLLRECARRQLPLWCSNPDLVTVVGGVNYVMPGSLAQAYEKMLADEDVDAETIRQLVLRFGKPELPVYETVHRILGLEPVWRKPPTTVHQSTATRAKSVTEDKTGASTRLLAIGDSLLHDILGGHNAGMDTVLVAGGIYAREFFGIPADAESAASIVLQNKCEIKAAAVEYLLHHFDSPVTPSFVTAYFRW